MTNKIYTPAGYEYDEPVTTGQPDVDIHLSYETAFDIVLDGITSEASIEPITEATFKALTVNLLGLLIDANEDLTPVTTPDSLASGRYVAVISASTIWKYEVTFFVGPPVAWGDNSKEFGWVNEVKSTGCSFLWTAQIAARRGLKYLNRMDKLNTRMGTL